MAELSHISCSSALKLKPALFLDLVSFRPTKDPKFNQKWPHNIIHAPRRASKEKSIGCSTVKETFH